MIDEGTKWDIDFYWSQVEPENKRVNKHDKIEMLENKNGFNRLYFKMLHLFQ